MKTAFRRRRERGAAGKQYIKDEKAPKLSNYGFTTNGTVNPDNENELFIKLGTENEANPDERYSEASLTLEAHHFSGAAIRLPRPFSSRA